ncbi:MAG: hypothetical protein H6819_06760 [Phycisphaerales bacterium]|nr:hypothetical protein [Phycisphaerales bacterium]
MDSWAQWAPSVVLGVIGWLLKNSIGRFGDRITRVESDVVAKHAEMAARHDALNQRVMELDESKANKEDHIRETARTRQSLEKVSETVARIDGKLDSGMHIAAGINRLADAMEAQKDNG